MNEAIALAELISYMEDACEDTEHAPIFKLADLVKIYSARAKQLRTSLPSGCCTHLKERILEHFSRLGCSPLSHQESRDVLLVFYKDIGSAIRKACNQDADSDTTILARAANIIRRDTFSNNISFTGAFDSHCQESSVPSSLVALVSMILYGPNIKSQSNNSLVPQTTLIMSQ